MINVMRVTDEMVDLACVALNWAELQDAGLPPGDLADETPESAWEASEDQLFTRRHVRLALEAALSSHK